MSQMIASDVANPEYVGRADPDASLSVLFYGKALQNEFESEQQGRPIFYDADMVKIIVPGDDKNIIDTFAREDHKRRFPRQWAHYQNNLSGDQRLAGKTPIDQWPRLSKAQVEELRAMRFLAIDDVANASDSHIQTIGMAAGMSPHAFRDAARAYLRVAAGEATETQAAARAEAAEQANAELKQQMATLMARIDAMTAPAPAAPAAPVGDSFAALAGANPVDPVVDTSAAPAKRTRGA